MIVMVMRMMSRLPSIGLALFTLLIIAVLRNPVDAETEPKRKLVIKPGLVSASA